MTPAQAAKQWLEADRALRKAGASALEKKRKEAGKVLATHMQERELTTYRGVSYAATKYDDIDAALVRSTLSAAALKKVTVERERVTLRDLNPPAAQAA